MDHFRLTTRMHAVARILTLAAATVGAFLVHHIDQGDVHPAYTIRWHSFLICLALEIVVALTSLAPVLSPRMQAMARGMSGPVLIANTCILTSADSAFVASAGGVQGPFWLVFIPLVVCGALNQTRRVALGIGAVSVVGLVGSALAAVKLHPTTTTWVHLAAICPILLLLSYVAGMVSELVMAGTSAVERERDVVTDHMFAVTGVLDRAAGGELSIAVPHPLDPGEQPSLEELSISMDRMLADLRGLVGQVRGGGEQVGASAAELLATAEQHAASATQQSTAVTETTTTIEELAATAGQIAETAEAVARYAAETLRYAEQGQEAVNASVEAMDTIGGSVDAMARRALTLGERTHEIGRIVEVIDDLADQTNLLALNAAIEAARAGDHGRGFAVVATEIRKLAERAQTSTGQIRAIVGEVQAETHATIVASEEGAKEARVGAELARGVAEALERIGGMVDETTTAAKEISIATQQQRSASEQVVAAMTQVSDVARQYAVGSQQTSASAAQLHGLASQLRESISRFTVDSAPSAALPVRAPRNDEDLARAY